MRLNVIALLIIPVMLAAQSNCQQPREGLLEGELGVICTCYTGKQANNHYFKLKKPGFGCEVCQEACKNEQPLWNRLLSPYNGNYSCEYVTREEDFGNKKARILAVK